MQYTVPQGEKTYSSHVPQLSLKSTWASVHLINLRCLHEKTLYLGYHKSTQWRFWLDCANGQLIWIFAGRTYPRGTFPDVAAYIQFNSVSLDRPSCLFNTIELGHRWNTHTCTHARARARTHAHTNTHTNTHNWNVVFLCYKDVYMINYTPKLFLLYRKPLFLI